MKRTKGSFKSITATLLAILIGGVILSSAHAQRSRNTITFVNQSGEPALVKMVGPTDQTVKVPHGQNRTLNVAAGEYYLLVRYGNEPNGYTYSRGDSFIVEESAMQYSVITITLHKVVGGNYSTHPASREEFDRAIPSRESMQ